MRKSSARPWALVAALAVDAAVLWWFWQSLLRFRRPLDVLLILAIVLAILTAVAGGRWIRSGMLAVIAVAVCLLAVEMAQKFFDILALGPKHAIIYGGSGPYSWNSDDALTYVEAKRRAVEAGDYAPPMGERFAGDIFAGREAEVGFRSTGFVANRHTGVEALKFPAPASSPTQLDFAPDNLMREYSYTDAGEMLYDGRMTLNQYGFRHTAGSEDAAASTVIFLGCSQTYGTGLSDDETAAHFFAEAGGFSERVLNISRPNAGPHQALRELELEYSIGCAGVRADRVRAVIFTLIDDHANRVVHPNNAQAPYYAYENGEAVWRGTFADSPHYGKWGVLLGRSRVFPTLWDRVLRLSGAGSYKWRLAHAILRRMDAICRERYGVGLTVMYWDETPEVMAELEHNGIRVVPLSAALGENWRDMAIRHLLCEGHASSYTNRLIGATLYRELDTQPKAGD